MRDPLQRIVSESSAALSDPAHTLLAAKDHIIFQFRSILTVGAGALDFFTK